MVIDEAHRLKNPTSRLFEHLCSIPHQHCLLLTGTPLQNKTEVSIHIFSLRNCTLSLYLTCIHFYSPLSSLFTSLSSLSSLLHLFVHPQLSPLFTIPLTFPPYHPTSHLFLFHLIHLNPHHIPFLPFSTSRYCRSSGLYYTLPIKFGSQVKQSSYSSLEI